MHISDRNDRDPLLRSLPHFVSSELELRSRSTNPCLIACKQLRHAKRFVAAAAAVDAARDDDTTALMCAAMKDHDDVVAVLVAAGAAVDASSHNGKTALMLALLEGDDDVVTALFGGRDGGGRVDE